jgi:hypothetical protein
MPNPPAASLATTTPPSPSIQPADNGAAVRRCPLANDAGAEDIQRARSRAAACHRLLTHSPLCVLSPARRRVRTIEKQEKKNEVTWLFVSYQTHDMRKETACRLKLQRLTALRRTDMLRWNQAAWLGRTDPGAE